MAGTVNYQRELEKLISEIGGKNPPKLLLHSCCAPCSSYVLEYLSQFFEITVYYYNPNIQPEEEYQKRLAEQSRLIGELEVKNPISLIEGEYNLQVYFDAVQGKTQEREGGERCVECFRFRLEESARLAAENGFDYFTTTLSISPYKNAAKLGELAEEISQVYSVKNLPSDFKKKNGYKRSIELSREHNLYRQDYCGCAWSKAEMEHKD